MNDSTPNAKPKKPIFKKWWFWVIIALIVIIGIAGSGGREYCFFLGRRIFQQSRAQHRAPIRAVRPHRLPPLPAHPPAHPRSRSPLPDVYVGRSTGKHNDCRPRKMHWPPQKATLLTPLFPMTVWSIN